MEKNMLVTIGISVLIGAALGLRFNVLILVPTIVLAAVSTATIGIAHGDQIWSVALAMVFVVTALQISYLAGTITRAAVAGLVQPNKDLDVAQNFGHPADLSGSSMFKMLDIQERMEVVGSDGNHVGAVDHKERDRIILTRDDPKAGGKPHLISVDWVDYVDSKVHLNKPSEKAVVEWQVAA
jgi:hypothetical protein